MNNYAGSSNKCSWNSSKALFLKSTCILHFEEKMTNNIFQLYLTLIGLKGLVFCNMTLNYPRTTTLSMFFLSLELSFNTSRLVNTKVGVNEVTVRWSGVALKSAYQSEIYTVDVHTFQTIKVLLKKYYMYIYLLV